MMQRLAGIRAERCPSRQSQTIQVEHGDWEEQVRTSVDNRDVRRGLVRECCSLARAAERRLDRLL